MRRLISTAPHVERDVAFHCSCQKCIDARNAQEHAYNLSLYKSGLQSYPSNAAFELQEARDELDELRALRDLARRLAEALSNGAIDLAAKEVMESGEALLKVIRASGLPAVSYPVPKDNIALLFPGNEHHLDDYLKSAAKRLGRVLVTEGPQGRMIYTDPTIDDRALSQTPIVATGSSEPWMKGM